MKLDYSLIAFCNHILGVQLSAVGKNLPQLREGAFDEGLLAEVVTGQRVDRKSVV